jgi:hypothetical protein
MAFVLINAVTAWQLADAEFNFSFLSYSLDDQQDQRSTEPLVALLQ